MFAALGALFVLAAILAVSELVWKRVKVHPELARKFVHITCGIFIAFLPFWISYGWVQLMALGFIAVNIINHRTNYFHAIRAVRRRSIGDILFGVGVLAVALFEPAPWLFALAILQVSLADGLAAVFGVTFGERHGKYYLFTQPKTIVGSAVFIAASATTLAVGFFTASYFVDPVAMLPVIALLPFLLVCVENMAVFGLDNLALPLVTLGVLNLF